MTLALVTGASRGIGRATALKLAQQGYRVAVNYRQRAEEAQQVVAEIREQGGEAFAVQADIADEAQVVALFQRLDEEAMPLGVLVNNAGILFTQCRVEDLSAERLQRVFATNVTGAFLCCREAVKRMGTHHGGQGGTIINVSSAASRLGAPGEYVDYAASKGAMDTLTRGLSLEVAAQGIRVNGVRPGFIYTEMHADGGEPGRVDRVAGMAGVIPMGRGGEAEEIAEAIAWLASEAASYITGTFIDAAGGR
ncbi:MULTISPECIES: SDR family oxidoreductase [Pantoea]|jgi:NAD(P)-dependent dehydrogenase (short-subunit alcohol dehydrogenase family)|uniref:SDR family oxidoreductase n=1 Tax=Pantoea TaxID=53335 RepID=UPI000EA1B623|nr:MULTISPECIES: SDR family oxidoreductase [Pantoea]MBZ6385751.1 SDR family oxidoreductase [Pantoea piersonii]MBZ6399122.1 SDR family oxidoreductase [Pantoea piersonii]MBZ6406492.1 SDR family oxidoreductase [Pantoea piersonii]MBZ6428152.1 SDR family oxidoreductase [Pantoea piersonii]NYB02216.1 SDR family oxidoreductase [Pantoea piersonii]